MQAAEIETGTAKPRKIASTPNANWYVVSKNYIKKHVKNLRPPLGMTNYLYKSVEHTWYNAWFTLVGNDLHLLAGNLATGTDIQPLLNAQPQIRTGSGVYLGDLNNKIIWDGELVDPVQLLTKNEHHLFDIPPDYKVYEIPKTMWWVADKLNVGRYSKTTRLLLLTWHSAMYGVAINGDQILGVVTPSRSEKLPQATWVKIIKNLTSELNLKAPPTTVSNLLPQGRVHKLLQWVDQNPGMPRWKVYSQGLKLKQMPSPGSENDTVNSLYKWQLLHADQDPLDEFDAPLTITARGKMILAMLNNNKKVPLDVVIKE